MEWVEAEPSQPGWYWYEDGRHETRPVEVLVGMNGRLVVVGYGRVSDLKGRWSERLLEPVELGK